jgi:hypothetical protein
MKRHKRWTMLVTTSALVLAMAVPATADPPEVFEADIFSVFLDLENELVGFWNITRDDLCDWEGGGFQGPAPVGELVTAQVVETGKGALVGSFHATRSLELWQLDEDADLTGACEDTDDQTGPLLTGTATVTSNDNDIDVSGTRINSFGERGQGTVEGTDGSKWRYSWTVRLQIDRDFEFRVVTEQTNLKQIG